MSAAARREIAAVARTMRPMTRGARFLARRQGLPTFAAICAAPRWPMLESEAQARLGALALILAGASQLAREIDGQRLRGYAHLIGAPVLDQIIGRGEEGRDSLTPAQQLPAAAQRLLAEAEQGNAHAKACMMRAERFLKEVEAWPST